MDIISKKIINQQELVEPYFQVMNQVAEWVPCPKKKQLHMDFHND